MVEAKLQTFDNVPISDIGHDSLELGWSGVPRQLLLDWQSVVTKVARVLQPSYGHAELPLPLVFKQQTIPSDGPYSSSENFYYLDYFCCRTDSIVVHFEAGRHGGNEPLCMETARLGLEVSSYTYPQAAGQTRARFYVWCTEDQIDPVKQALGLT